MSKKKTYPLDVEGEMLDKVPEFYIHCRGHHDPVEFSNAVKEFLGPEKLTQDAYYGKKIEPDQVIHTYMRCRPVNTDEYTTELTECGPGRGAYPITRFKAWVEA